MANQQIGWLGERSTPIEESEGTCQAATGLGGGMVDWAEKTTHLRQLFWAGLVVWEGLTWQGTL
jgi:hypothetical protein